MRALRRPNPPAHDDPERELAYAIAQLVHDLRTAQGLSQAQLAELMDTKQPQVSRIEGANTLPSLAVLVRAARALGCELVITFEKTEGTTSA